MELKEEKQFSPRCVDVGASGLPNDEMQQAQGELRRANSHLKYTRVAYEAVCEALRSLTNATEAARRVSCLAQGRVEDCQRRIYELS